MVRRALGLLLAGAILLSAAPAGKIEVSAATAEEISTQSTNSTIGYTWDEESKTLTITGEGPMDDYKLNTSSQYNVYPAWAFIMPNAEKIVISEGITYVGKYAFWDSAHECSNLKEW